MALGRPLGAKLFLEGKEVPFIGASITSSVGQASIAYIDLVPHKSINDIKPRTLVHLFVRDYQNEDKNFPYVLAWQGEVFGYNFGKTPASRSFSISCIDLSSYWDNCLAYFFNSKQCLGSGFMAKASQAQDLFELKVLKERVLEVSMSQAEFYRTEIKKVTEQKGKDFLDAFVALYKKVGIVNEFFQAAEQRLRISDQIVLHSSKKLEELVSDKAVMNWYMEIPNRSSGYSTLRMIIQDLMSIIFHDFVSIPFPAAVKSDGASMIVGRRWLPNKKNVQKTIGSFVFKPNLYMMPPPACNIFFPDEYSSFQFNRNFFKEPTRLIYMPEMPARFGQGGPAVIMPHVYEPAAFSDFMKKASGDYKKYQNKSDTGIPANVDPMHYGSPDTSYSKEINAGNKRDSQFLTSEEYMKGIIMARENMVPAASSFRYALDKTLGTYQKGDFVQKVAKYLFYKKRFQDRQLQITSHLKLSVVPGFSVLLMDDSDADQNVMAYCESVTHRIYAKEGGYTNVHLSYARTVNEQETSSEFGNQYLIPPWFDETIFGEATAPPVSKSAPSEVSKMGVTHVSTEKLSDFYKTLLGDKGSRSITNLFSDEPTMLGAVRQLIIDYRATRDKGARDVQAYIAKTTARDYVSLKDCFKFYLAESKTTDMENDKWIEFSGDIFSRKSYSDESVVTARNKVIKTYRDILRGQRGFRG